MTASYKFVRVSESGVVSSLPTVVMRVLLYGGREGIWVKLHDGEGGAVLLSLDQSASFADVGGVTFSAGLFAEVGPDLKRFDGVAHLWLTH